MKTLNKYIEEKLIVNRHYHADDSKVCNIVKKFIDEYVTNLPKHGSISPTSYYMLFRSSIEVSLNNLLVDNYINDDVLSEALKRFDEVKDNMLKYFNKQHIFRFCHGIDVNSANVNVRIREPLNDMYNELEKNGVELEQIYNTKVNAGAYNNIDFFIECFDGDDVKIIHMGTELYAFTFILLV